MQQPKIFKQSELNRVNYRLTKQSSEGYRRETVRLQEILKDVEGYSKKDREKAEDLLKNYQALAYYNAKAMKELEKGATFTQALWGCDKGVDITHSWVIVNRVEFGPIIKAVGVLPGKKGVEFIMKKDGTWDGINLYSIGEARRLISMLIDNAEDQQKPYFYLYNVVTGQEEVIDFR